MAANRINSLQRLHDHGTHAIIYTKHLNLSCNAMHAASVKRLSFLPGALVGKNQNGDPQTG